MDNFKLEDLKDKRFYFVGIGGISMSALAFFLHQKGFAVSGSDLAKNDEVVKLQRAGIIVFNSHKKENIKGSNVVVFSSAIGEDNEEILEAKKQNLIIMKRAELLGIIAGCYETVIAIAGSHGKTTASGMLVETLKCAKLNPSYHIGGVLQDNNSNYSIASNKYFVVEACEYKDNFLFLKPDYALVLNIDSDHLDYFKDLDGVKNSFLKFAKLVQNPKNVIANADDKNSALILKFSSTFGVKNIADVMAKDIQEYRSGYYSFNVFYGSKNLGKMKLNILGKHNILNALAVIQIALKLGIDFDVAKVGIENYKGVKRRCEFICRVNGAEVYHDYAHHPKQIEKMILTFKKIERQKKGRVIVVFEPHTYSRTKFLFDEFIFSLSLADVVVLAPVYSARELPEMGYNSLKLYDALKSKNKSVYFGKTYDEIKLEVERQAEKNDTVLVLGAGTIENLAYKWK